MNLIPVSERKPEHNVYVLVLCQHRYIPQWGDGMSRTWYLAALEKDENDKEFWWGHGAGRELRDVTHWAYLPQMPD